MNTPIKNFRCADDLRKALREEAERQGKTQSDIIRDALKAYLTEEKTPAATS